MINSYVKYILAFLLILSPFFVSAQDNNDVLIEYEPSFKSELSLDIFLMGVEFTYKRKINKQLFWGVGLGGLMQKYNRDSFMSMYFSKSLLENSSYYSYIDILRLKLLVDYELNSNVHFSGGITSGLTYYEDYSLIQSIEFGIFYKFKKPNIEIGFMPSFPFSLRYFKMSFGFVPFLIRVPLKKWGKSNLVQGKGKPFVLFNELSVFANRTLVADDNTIDKFGGGFSLNRSFYIKPKLELLIGLEYSHTKVFKKELETYRNDTYVRKMLNSKLSLHSFNIPIASRIKLGRKNNIFIEPRGYISIMLKSNLRGTAIGKFMQYVEISNSGNLLRYTDAYTFGGGIGVGYIQRINQFELLYKPYVDFSTNKRGSETFDIYNHHVGLSVTFRKANKK